MLTRVGGRLPITATGVGLVLLAHAPVDVQEEVLAGPFERYTPYTVTDPRELRRMLADVRTTGFAVSDRQLSDETVSVAAPGARRPEAGGRRRVARRPVPHLAAAAGAAPADHRPGDLPGPRRIGRGPPSGLIGRVVFRFAEVPFPVRGVCHTIVAPDRE